MAISTKIMFQQQNMNLMHIVQKNMIIISLLRNVKIEMKIQKHFMKK